jgi:uncharacterized protein
MDRLAPRILFFALLHTISLIVLPSGGRAQEEAILAPMAADRAQSLSAAAVERERRQDEARRLTNQHMVAILGAGVTSTYSQFAEDIRNVVEAAANSEMRVLPILGRSESQGLLDVIYLKGVDMGIVNQDVMSYWKKKDPLLYSDVNERMVFIAKLFNAELHILAHKDINSLADLRGRKVNCQQPMSAVSIMCETIFSAIKLPVEITHSEAELGIERLRKGEVAAAARLGGAPIPGLTGVSPEDNLHFVPIGRRSLSTKDFATLRAHYLPARLKHEDYPRIIPAGEETPTLATSAVLAVYARSPDSERYRELEKFVKLLFDNIDELRKAPHHPRWKDVALGAEVSGWRRFKPAQDWLNAKQKAQPPAVKRLSEPATPGRKTMFNQFLEDYSRQTNVKDFSQEQREALLDHFVRWLETQNGPTAAATPNVGASAN